MLPRSLAILAVTIILSMIMTQQRKASLERVNKAREQVAPPPVSQTVSLDQGRNGSPTRVPAGLEPSLNAVEFEKYQKVSHGMSYNQVWGVMGPGVEIDRDKWSSTNPEYDRVTYRWPTASGAEIHMTFSGNQLIHKEVKLKQ